MKLALIWKYCKTMILNLCKLAYTIWWKFHKIEYVWKSFVGSNHRLILSSRLSKPSAKTFVWRIYGFPSTLPRNSKSSSSRLGWSDVSCNTQCQSIHESNNTIEEHNMWEEKGHIHNRPRQCQPNHLVLVWFACQFVQTETSGSKKNQHLDKTQ